MPPRSPRHRLHDILEAIDRISTYTGGDLRRAIDDRTIRDAVLYNLAVIGEATKNLPAEMKEGEGTVDWIAVGGMRDAVVHEYFRIDLNRIKTLDRHLSTLKGVVERLSRDLRDD